MGNINNLKVAKKILNDDAYCLEYTFDNGFLHKIFNKENVLQEKRQKFTLQNGGNVEITEKYTNNKINERITVIVDEHQQKSVIKAIFDENGYCLDIYNSTKENNENVEYHYDLRGYKDTEGKFFKYAPAGKIINKGLPIEKRIIYRYNPDDTVTVTTKNALGEVVSEERH